MNAMAETPTHYELLGVSEDALPSDIKSAFRREAKRQHPDQGGNPAVFRMVEDAYEVLISPDRRAQYDADLRGGEPTPPGGVRVNDQAGQEQWADEPWADDWADDNWVDGPYGSPGHGAPGGAPQGGPIFVTAPPHPQRLSSRLPEWFPTSMVKRRIKILMALAFLGLILLFTGQLVPGFGSAGLVALLAWAVLAFYLGSIILRAAAWCLVLYALITYYLDQADLATTLMRSGIAIALWFAGQWYYTYRRGKWHSYIAYRVLGHLPPRLRPDRRWEMA